MAFELGKLVLGAAGSLGARLAARARDLRRRAHARAGQVWRDVGEILDLAPAPPRPAREPSNAEPNRALGPSTAAIVETMVEVLARSGYSDVRADVEGVRPPGLVRGTVRSHRPSLSAVGGGRPVLLDVFVPGEVEPEDQLSRWNLFASAAEQTGGEFHVVVPAWIEGGPGKEWARRLAEAVEVRILKIWEV